MNRSTFNKTVAPGLFAYMIDAFQELPQIWRNVCAVKPSKKAYEESVFYAGFGYVPVKPEGEPVQYDEMIQGPKLIGLLKSNLEIIKRAISGKTLTRAIPRKDCCE